VRVDRKIPCKCASTLGTWRAGPLFYPTHDDFRRLARYECFLVCRTSGFLFFFFFPFLIPISRILPLRHETFSLHSSPPFLKCPADHINPPSFDETKLQGPVSNPVLPLETPRNRDRTRRDSSFPFIFAVVSDPAAAQALCALVLPVMACSPGRSLGRSFFSFFLAYDYFPPIGGVPS